MALRVALADDHLLVREAISEMLHAAADIDLVVLCEDADALRAAVAEIDLDVIVTDIRMPPDMTDDGIRLATDLRRTHPELAVVVLSAYCEPAYALALFKDGSDGRAYLLKDRVHERAQLLTTIRQVAQGGSMIDPKVVEVLVRADARGPGAALDSLSPRERQILAHMAAGESNGGIAESLGLTKRAVEKHINGMFAKLELPATPEVSRRVRAVLLFLARDAAQEAPNHALDR